MLSARSLYVGTARVAWSYDKRSAVVLIPIASSLSRRLSDIFGNIDNSIDGSSVATSNNSPRLGVRPHLLAAMAERGSSAASCGVVVIPPSSIFPTCVTVTPERRDTWRSRTSSASQMSCHTQSRHSGRYTGRVHASRSSRIAIIAFQRFFHSRSMIFSGDCSPSSSPRHVRFQSLSMIPPTGAMSGA